MSDGTFAWKRRMGVHEAYHQAPANRLLHWACIPFELWAVVKLLSLVPIGPVDLAVLVIAAVAPIFLLTEVVMGASMVLFLVACREVGLRVLPETPGWGAALAALVFAITFGVQVGVGHRVFEEGRDDTEKNFAELGRTRNPVPILLVFYYHLVELFLGAGYRPGLRREIEAHTARELASFGAPDPKAR